MLNLITTTKTITNRDGDDFIITNWTVGGYTLVRTECPALDRDSWNAYASNDLPSIVDRTAVMSKTPKFGVNWFAQGTQSSFDARAYAALLATAADVADVFTRIAANG